MKQEDWKIIYSKYDGVAKRAIHLLSKEAGRLLIREEKVYRIYVLPCEKEGCLVSKNAFFVSLYEDSETIRRFVSPEEVPADGFAVKVVKNPDDEEGRFVLLTAHTEQELFYAVVSFLDDYMPRYDRMDLLFDKVLPLCAYSERPDHKTRSIFTWGHSINDYRAYIDNMARVKLNEVIIWNDFVPINIKEIIEYAHSYGIRVIMGYSWGWREISNKAEVISEESIERVRELAIAQYRESYADLECDGIYFQSFTERKENVVGGKTIATMVTDMVNQVAEELWKINPSLRLIFGLHATSVKTKLDEIARVDPRMEILWEDCGEFPFAYSTAISSEAAFEETLDFIKQILSLRGGKGVGLAFKGVMMLDWSKKVEQHGPYIMGENSVDIANHDRRLRDKGWRQFAADWMKNGHYAHRMMQFINENEITDTTMCLAGTFDGGIYLPFALSAEMFRSLQENYLDVLHRVSRRACIRVD